MGTIASTDAEGHHSMGWAGIAGLKSRGGGIGPGANLGSTLGVRVKSAQRAQDGLVRAADADLRDERIWDRRDEYPQPRNEELPNKQLRCE
jgi:hypothetical protein